GQREGALVHVLDRTVTPMGARLLQEWILAPLGEQPAIKARLEAVAELKEDTTLRRELREQLKETYDLQRLTTRASTGRASPRDLAGIAGTLRLLPRLKARVTARQTALHRDLEAPLELCPELREARDKTLI